MAEVVPVYHLLSGNYAALQGVDPAVDTVTFKGLTMNGVVAMDSTGGGTPNKITGLASATADEDALAYGQTGADLNGLNLTANLTMNSQKITGLDPGTAGTDGVNKNQLDSVAAGVAWKHAVQVLRMVNDALATSPTLTAGDAGKAYVVAGTGGDWSTFTIGDIVEWDGSAWNLVLAGSGAEPPDGTYVIIVETSAAGSFAGQENEVAVYNATTNTWAFTPASDGDGRTVAGENSVYENLGYVWDATPGEWVMFNGPGQIVAGAGLTKTFNQLDANVKDGIQIDADAITLLLAATPGLQLTGTSPAKVLSVLPDGAKGVEVGASGVAVIVESDGAIEFDGTNGGLEINLEASNPTLDIVSNELGVKYSATAGGLTQDSTGLKVKVDGTTITINGSGQLVGASADGDRIADDYVVSENISAGDPVYWSTTANQVAQGDAAQALWPSHAQIFGVAEDAATTGNSSTIVSRGPCLGVLSSATPGDIYWMAVGGGITTTIPSTNNALIRAGWAKNADDLFVSIADYGRRGY
ncbi:MAG: hypothetical protein ACTSW7_01160 [Candidatus Thorarchaeota archaeon]|nr:hypothetical protein [Thermoplasmatales archaeon]